LVWIQSRFVFNSYHPLVFLSALDHQ
jgi:hypothetical protein